MDSINWPMVTRPMVCFKLVFVGNSCTTCLQGKSQLARSSEGTFFALFLFSFFWSQFYDMYFEKSQIDPTESAFSRFRFAGKVLQSQKLVSVVEVLRCSYLLCSRWFLNLAMNAPVINYNFDEGLFAQSFDDNSIDSTGVLTFEK